MNIVVKARVAHLQSVLQDAVSVTLVPELESEENLAWAGGSPTFQLRMTMDQSTAVNLTAGDEIWVTLSDSAPAEVTEDTPAAE